MATNFSLDDMKRSYESQGYVRIATGVRDIWILELLAASLGAVRGIWGKTYQVDFRPEREEIKNSVAQSSTELPPHTDGTFEIDLPPSFLLQIIESDLPGYGVSVLIDGWKVIERLSSETVDILMNTPFKFYRAEMGREVTLYAPIIELRNSAYEFRYRNDRKHPLIAPTNESSHALEELVSVIGSDELHTEFQLNSGDLLWVNNRRMIHGRTRLSNKVPRSFRRFWLQY